MYGSGTPLNNDTAKGVAMCHLLRPPVAPRMPAMAERVRVCNSRLLLVVVRQYCQEVHYKKNKFE